MLLIADTKNSTMNRSPAHENKDHPRHQAVISIAVRPVKMCYVHAVSVGKHKGGSTPCLLGVFGERH